MTTPLDFRIDSTALGEKRKITVFLPPHYDANTRYPVVFCADGQTIHGFSRRLHESIANDLAPPVILVGAHSHARRRFDEYIESADHRRFQTYERFFTEEVFRWARKEFRIATCRQSCGVFGCSHGGAFALKHPRQYSVVIVFSVVGAAERASAATFADQPIPRFYLSVGTREKPLRKTTRKIARLLEKHGAECIHTERCAGLDFHFWDSELPKAIGWSFKDQGGSSDDE